MNLLVFLHYTLMRRQYIADRLLKLNERGTWHDPPPADPALRAKQDEEIFQTARLVKYVHYSYP
jgi:linoleate 10R-lipoxygenase